MSAHTVGGECVLLFQYMYNKISQCFQLCFEFFPAVSGFLFYVIIIFLMFLLVSQVVSGIHDKESSSDEKVPFESFSEIPSDSLDEASDEL